MAAPVARQAVGKALLQAATRHLPSDALITAHYGRSTRT